MSREIRVIIAIGTRVLRSEIFVQRKIRGCGHKLDASGLAKYCSQCGRPVFVERTLPIEQYSPHGTPDSDFYPTLCGFACIESPTFDDFLVATDVHHKGVGLTPLDNFPLDDREAKLRAALEPIGLWSWPDFGRYVLVLDD